MDASQVQMELYLRHRNKGRRKKEQRATYDSVSESSVSRLLATLFARPSESSLWYG
jgi:hypothetical protein